MQGEVFEETGTVSLGLRRSTVLSVVLCLIRIMGWKYEIEIFSGFRRSDSEAVYHNRRHIVNAMKQNVACRHCVAEIEKLLSRTLLSVAL